VCDGASSNFSVKASHGCHFGFSFGKDPYMINLWFVNPYDSLSHIYALFKECCMGNITQKSGR